MQTHTKQIRLEQQKRNKQDSVRTFERLRKKSYIPPEVLDEFYQNLEPVTLKEIWGKWKGGYFYTGNNWGLLLELPVFKWYGKEFRSKEEVDALVFEIMHIKFALPIGRASVEMKIFRDKRSTAMTYKYLPVTDYFRKVDPNIFMGVMETRIPGMETFYFYIIRDLEKH